ncbi:putative barnase/colicin E5 family endoribonuclease [Helicobacter ailurogastricus]|uniref:putative barnase/colicin E5 family endoribonuclease n=1 Tax=Helicobacter ailurogastricus TaxID=1578720 RepID=UPI0013152693|nr:hypothetical protein [Helicobacter ailurogastricus]
MRYAYVLKEPDGVTLRVVVDAFNDGKKVFDFYSERNFTDYQGGYSPKLPTADNKPTTTPLKIKANPAFGENFAEYAGKGAEAVKKLLEEKRGQVSGAFYRPDLGESGGYIDLVWGAVKNKEGKIEGHGLSKIVEKHL